MNSIDYGTVETMVPVFSDNFKTYEQLAQLKSENVPKLLNN